MNAITEAPAQAQHDFQRGICTRCMADQVGGAAAAPCNKPDSATPCSQARHRWMRTRVGGSTFQCLHCHLVLIDWAQGDAAAKRPATSDQRPATSDQRPATSVEPEWPGSDVLRYVEFTTTGK